MTTQPKTKPAYRWHWDLLQSWRGLLGLIGISMGLGRLSGLSARLEVTFFFSELFGWLLVTGGLALLVTLPVRLRLSGRIAAVVAVFCFAFMAAATAPNTAALLYLLCAGGSIIEAISRREYEC